jgi:hypothetical protein
MENAESDATMEEAMKTERSQVSDEINHEGSEPPFCGSSTSTPVQVASTVDQPHSVDDGSGSEKLEPSSSDPDPGRDASFKGKQTGVSEKAAADSTADNEACRQFMQHALLMPIWLLTQAGTNDNGGTPTDGNKTSEESASSDQHESGSPTTLQDGHQFSLPNSLSQDVPTETIIDLGDAGVSDTNSIDVPLAPVVQPNSTSEVDRLLTEFQEPGNIAGVAKASLLDRDTTEVESSAPEEPDVKASSHEPTLISPIEPLPSLFEDFPDILPPNGLPANSVTLSPLNVLSLPKRLSSDHDSALSPIRTLFPSLSDDLRKAEQPIASPRMTHAKYAQLRFHCQNVEKERDNWKKKHEEQEREIHELKEDNKELKIENYRLGKKIEELQNLADLEPLPWESMTEESNFWRDIKHTSNSNWVLQICGVGDSG